MSSSWPRKRRGRCSTTTSAPSISSSGCSASRGEWQPGRWARTGLTLEGARDEVASRIGRGKKPVNGHIPFTPRAKKVLELGLREALALHHHYIGTEHLLLGLIREGDGVGAEILSARAGDPLALRMSVLDLVPAGTPGLESRLGRDVPACSAAVWPSPSRRRTSGRRPPPRSAWTRPRGWPAEARWAPTTCCWRRWGTRTPPPRRCSPGWGSTSSRPARHSGTPTSPAPATSSRRRRAGAPCCCESPRTG